MKHNKEAKRLLLNQSCNNCIWRNNPYKLLHMWCIQHGIDRVTQEDWCDCWVTDEVDVSGYYRNIVVTLEDVQHFKDLVKRRSKNK